MIDTNTYIALKLSHTHTHTHTLMHVQQLAVFPGFNPDSHTPLPNGLDTLVVMRLVTSTQSRLSLQPSFRERWKKIFYSQPSQNVFLVSSTQYWLPRA